jgi:wyosine [tRNA(Phe)-imidazoG37] synthetase (radical SAM superfamily)
MSSFAQETAQVLKSMFFKRVDVLGAVRPGCTFRRVHPDNMVETAKVVSVAEDAHGIPHVKFQVSFARPNRGALSEETSRMLALRTFADRYKEQVPA